MVKIISRLDLVTRFLPAPLVSYQHPSFRDESRRAGRRPCDVGLALPQENPTARRLIFATVRFHPDAGLHHNCHYGVAAFCPILTASKIIVLLVMAIR
jgi:hypothetical protein